MRPRLHRRTFLKFGALLSAAGLRPAPAPVCTVAVASALPLPFPHDYIADADKISAGALAGYDLLLVPAYVAAGLIRVSALMPLPPEAAPRPGRAHDPDGAYTIPYASLAGAVLYTGPAPRSLADLWQGEALWPDSPRLAIGTALLRRGYSFNDSHPGHLAQVEADLKRLRPRIGRGDPAAVLRSGRAALALGLFPVPGETPAPGLFLPPEGAPLVEYDWVIPAGAVNVQAALDLVGAGVSPGAPGAPPRTGLIPVMPLPEPARRQYAAIWAHVKATA